MLLDPVALAWSSWLGLGVSLGGTFVSLVGLLLTFREARRAKIAALAATSEVAKIVAMVRSRTRLSALSSAVSQADMIGAGIDETALRGSRGLFTAFRRVVKEAIAITGMVQSPSGQPRTQEVEQALEALAALIDADVEVKEKKGQMRMALNTISSFLIHQEAAAKTEDLS